MSTPARASVNHEHYTYRTMWSPADDEYVATVAEFPSLSCLAPVRSEAQDELIRLVGDIVADMEAADEALPVPFGERAYSGKFQVRTTEALHRQLSVTAHEQGVSLNRLVNDRLARA